MPPLLQQVRGATVLTIYDRHTFQFTCCIHKLVHTFHLYTRQKSITQAEEEWDFLSSREGESPSWINPCLRVLVPSPSWIGLDSFCSFFPPPLHFEWTQQQVPRFLAAPNPVWRWTLDSVLTYRKYIFLSCLIMPLPSLSLSLSLLSLSLSLFSPFYAFSLFFFFLHFIFLLVTAAVVFYESGGFFLPGFL